VISRLYQDNGTTVPVTFSQPCIASATLRVAYEYSRRKVLIVPYYRIVRNAQCTCGSLAQAHKGIDPMSVIAGLLINEHATILVDTAEPKQALYARQLTILVLSHIDRTWCTLAQSTNQ
jgi:hypothetical protein